MCCCLFYLLPLKCLMIWKFLVNTIPLFLCCFIKNQLDDFQGKDNTNAYVEMMEKRDLKEQGPKQGYINTFLEKHSK